MRLNIKNWVKFNPRTELKSMPWFRVQSKIISDRKLFGLTADQKWLWICLLSLAASDNSAQIIIDLPWLSHLSGVEKNSITQAIDHFVKSGLVVHECTASVPQVVHECTASVPLHNSTRHNSTRHNSTKHNSTKQNIEKTNAKDFKFSPWDFKTASLFLEKVKQLNPNAVSVKKVNLEKWSDVFRLMRESDGLEIGLIETGLNFTFTDPFWSGVCQSPNNFRKNWDKIILKAKSKHDGSMSGILQQALSLTRNQSGEN